MNAHPFNLALLKNSKTFMQNVLVPGMLLLDRMGLKEYSGTPEKQNKIILTQVSRITRIFLFFAREIRTLIYLTPQFAWGEVQGDVRA